MQYQETIELYLFNGKDKTMNKIIAICCVVLLASAAPVFACTGCGCENKDKDKQALTPSFQTLCGGDKDLSPLPNPVPQCGGDGDKDKDTKVFAPSFQTLCGGDKCDKPAPEPAPQCGGGDNKDKENLKI